MDSPCKSDGECVDILTNNFIAAHNGVTKGNAPIFIDAINCYPDRQNTCGKFICSTICTLFLICHRNQSEKPITPTSSDRAGNILTNC